MIFWIFVFVFIAIGLLFLWLFEREHRIETERELESLRIDYQQRLADYAGLLQANVALLDTIRDVHSQRGDDVCWMDIDRIFAAAGLPVPDRRIGDKGAMLNNCRRFIDTMCAEDGWRTYADLENENAELRRQIKRLENQAACIGPGSNGEYR